MVSRNKLLLIQTQDHHTQHGLPNLKDLLGPLGVLSRIHLSDARSRLTSDAPRAVLIDCTTPDHHKAILELCKETRLQPKGHSLPVILISNECSDAFRLAAYEAGIDDLIVLPSCCPEEIRVRVQSKIQRVEQINARPALKTVQCGNLLLNLDGMEAHVNKRKLALSVLQFNLLVHLAKNSNRVIRRGELLEQVWKGAIVSLRTIDTHIVLLRKKLKGSDHIIETVYGAGYIFSKTKQPRPLQT